MTTIGIGIVLNNGEENQIIDIKSIHHATENIYIIQTEQPLNIESAGVIWSHPTIENIISSLRSYVISLFK